MIGYKAFNPDMTCRGFQYEVGKTYEIEGPIKLCERGFHFCEIIADCFSYYDKPNARFAKIETLGKVIKSYEDSKCVTDKIKILEEIPRDEALRMTNSGRYNSGNKNSGDYNSGDWNSGDCNSGDWNSGDYNSGDCNSGNCNSGNSNSGDWNSGDWNKSSFNNGCFMSVKPVIMMFNKPTSWTIENWRNSRSRNIMLLCPSEITDRQAWWDKLSADDKQEVMSLPNFDADVFYECTGIRVKAEDE